MNQQLYYFKIEFTKDNKPQSFTIESNLTPTQFHYHLKDIDLQQQYIKQGIFVTEGHGLFIASGILHEGHDKLSFDLMGGLYSARDILNDLSISHIQVDTLIDWTDEEQYIDEDAHLWQIVYKGYDGSTKRLVIRTRRDGKELNKKINTLTKTYNRLKESFDLLKRHSGTLFIDDVIPHKDAMECIKREMYSLMIGDVKVDEMISEYSLEKFDLGNVVRIVVDYGRKEEAKK